MCNLLLRDIEYIHKTWSYILKMFSNRTLNNYMNQKKAKKIYQFELVYNFYSVDTLIDQWHLLKIEIMVEATFLKQKTEFLTKKKGYLNREKYLPPHHHSLIVLSL